jgi:mannitol/fructose-specific phosphotransferase system IIA component (Ntr-type)
MTPDRIRVPIQSKDKASVIRELVTLAVNGMGGFDDILRAVMAREAALSTGIGYGVAIPHGKSSGVSDLRLAAGTSVSPMAFDSLDGQPVRLFFLLIGPETASADHVHALSRISRLVRWGSLRERLLSSATAQEFYQTLCDAESK